MIPTEIAKYKWSTIDFKYTLTPRISLAYKLMHLKLFLNVSEKYVPTILLYSTYVL